MTNRDEYIRKLQDQLDEWKLEIDRLEAQAKKASADAELEYKKQLRELRTRQDSARDKLDQLQKAGMESWQDLVSGMDRAWNELANAIKTAQSRF